MLSTTSITPVTQRTAYERPSPRAITPSLAVAKPATDEVLAIVTGEHSTASQQRMLSGALDVA